MSEIRYIDTPAEAEENAAKRMRELGYADARVTVGGADGGIDVESSKAVAQVKYRGALVGRPDIQRLAGAAHPRQPIELWFFSGTGYSDHAVRFAEDTKMLLFTFSPLGTLTAVNGAAKDKLDAESRLSSKSRPGPTLAADSHIRASQAQAIRDRANADAWANRAERLEPAAAKRRAQRAQFDASPLRANTPDGSQPLRVAAAGGSTSGGEHLLNPKRPANANSKPVALNPEEGQGWWIVSVFIALGLAAGWGCFWFVTIDWPAWATIPTATLSGGVGLFMLFGAYVAIPIREKTTAS